MRRNSIKENADNEIIKESYTHKISKNENCIFDTIIVTNLGCESKEKNGNIEVDKKNMKKESLEKEKELIEKNEKNELKNKNDDSKKIIKKSQKPKIIKHLVIETEETTQKDDNQYKLDQKKKRKEEFDSKMKKKLVNYKIIVNLLKT